MRRPAFPCWIINVFEVLAPPFVQKPKETHHVFYNFTRIIVGELSRGAWLPDLFCPFNQVATILTRWRSRPVSVIPGLLTALPFSG